jgi:hypothetical protein
MDGSRAFAAVGRFTFNASESHLRHCPIRIHVHRTSQLPDTPAVAPEGCSNATVSRTLALIRAIVRKWARDWEWLDPDAGGSAPQGAHTPNPPSEPEPGTCALARAAAASARHGGFHAGDRAGRGERDGAHLGAGRSLTQTRVDSSGPGESAASDRRAAQRHGDAVPASTADIRRGCSPTRVSPSGRSARGPGTTRSGARASRTSAGTTFATPGPPGTCRAVRRSSRCRSSRVRRRRRWCAGTRISPRSIWRSTSATRKVTAQIRHNNPTTGLPRHSSIATFVSVEKLRKFVVARGGIEPPTRGSSVQTPKLGNALIWRQCLCCHKAWASFALRLRCSNRGKKGYPAICGMFAAVPTRSPDARQNWRPFPPCFRELS